jgi:hypothetical protein
VGWRRGRIDPGCRGSLEGNWSHCARWREQRRIGLGFLDWEAGEGRADVNLDGGVDGADVSAFFFSWERGC